MRLTTLSEDDGQARRRVVRRAITRDELRFHDASPDQVSEVLEALSGPRSRLVVAGERNVEIAHEALLRHWPTLREWVEADFDGYRCTGT